MDRRNVPPFDHPSYEKLDAMTDAEYDQFARELRQWHAKWWPGTTFVLPRRKTPEEREREREELEMFIRDLEVSQFKGRGSDLAQRMGFHIQAGTKKRK